LTGRRDGDGAPRWARKACVAFERNTERHVRGVPV
jgi:hypothetical protein